MRLKLSFGAAALSVATLVALAGISAPAHAVTGDAPVTLQFRTSLNASQVGGSTVTPFRIIYQYSPDLAPGSGPFGSSDDGTYDSYGPLNKMIVELGDQCLALSGDGTSTTVFNNSSGSGTEDSIDVRADGAAVAGKAFYGHNLQFLRFLLVDEGGTMFSSTALPTSPLFADQSDYQQTEVDLLLTGDDSAFLVDSGPYSLNTYDPVSLIGAIIDEINGSQVTADLKTKLKDPLQHASTLLVNGLLTQKNNVQARAALDDFIKLVHSNRNKLGATTADSLTFDAQNVRAQLPACA